MRLRCLVVFLSFIFVACAVAQENALLETPKASFIKPARPVNNAGKISPLAQSRFLFPHNWIRGYTDFEVAPSHNEPDLGRCAFPQPVASGGMNSTCTAYARWMISGYLEMQPFGQTFARHIFLFFQPRISLGRNIPQMSYLGSMEPIAYDRSIGIGIQLPHNFQLRATQHQVDYLGRYSKSLGPADLGTNGPYGLYATVGVRWSFGGYAQAGNTQ
jgi:hypothetical protein